MTRRTRRRVEAMLALLAFPVAIALTIVVITAPAAGSRPSGPAGDSPTVAVRGGEPVARFGLADSLVARGYDLASVDDDGNSIRAVTEVVYYQREHRLDAERLRNLLGTGTIRREQVFAPGSDVTIHIGKDLDST